MRILPIFIPHLGCPFDCIYCNQKLITKSDLPDLKIIKQQIADFCRSSKENKEIALGGRTEDKEIAFYGGTFTALNRQDQQKYFDLVSPFLPKISGIRISTRPDFISKEELLFCKQNGVSTIELGIQSFSDIVLKTSGRGYTSHQAIKSCQLIESYSFQLGIQLMPGLPGFSSDSLRTSIAATIDLKPDFVRIYPTVILAGTTLHQMYETGKYSPLSLDEAIEISVEMKEIFEQNNIRIIKIGLHSDLDKDSIIAGPYHESFGELIRAESLMRKIVNNFSPKTLNISPADISLFKGFNCRMLSKLKSIVKIDKIGIQINPDLAKGIFLFTDSQPDNYW